MNVEGKHYRTIWVKKDDNNTIQIIDQKKLPHEFNLLDLKTSDEVVNAIKDMSVRGAGLIGATAGYGMYLATIEAKKSNNFDSYLIKVAEKLKASRPTAINLKWAVDRQIKSIEEAKTKAQKILIAFSTAKQIADEDAAFCKRIGEHGLNLIKQISENKQGETVNILTHCNAGWLAFVDYGSATAPIYEAFNKGIKLHVWVDETRPRNQGASLTAWELGKHGVAHTVI